MNKMSLIIGACLMLGGCMATVDASEPMRVAYVSPRVHRVRPPMHQYRPAPPRPIIRHYALARPPVRPVHVKPGPAVPRPVNWHPGHGPAKPARPAIAPARHDPARPARPAPAKQKR